MNLNEPPAEPADLYLGLGNLIYALAKVDGSIDVAESAVARRLISQKQFGRLALHAFFLLENCEASVDEAYAFAIRRFINNRAALTGTLRQQFVALLTDIAAANGDVSQKEQDLIDRFQEDLQRI